MAKNTQENLVAKDIEAICGKCGPVWHVITAVVNGKIEQVQFKQCYAYHRYRPVTKKEQTLKKDTKTAVARAVSASAPRKSPAPKQVKTLTPEIKPNDKEPQKYNIKNTYEIGDRVIHPVFGEGIVETIPETHKISVCFKTERKLLIQGK